MSVALIIDQIDDVEVEDYLPISTQRYFTEYWMPVCALYNLKWVPLFENGFPFTEDDLGEILDELIVVNRHFETTGNEYVKTRVKLLIEKLESLRGKKVSFFIG